MSTSAHVHAAVLLATLLAFSTGPAFAKDTFMVRMSDGVRLATDVHYPPLGSGPWPALLVRTPYDKNTDYQNPFWRLSGYVVVIQDTRGRFASEGVDRVFIDDGWGVPGSLAGIKRPQRDGLDTVAWVEAQSWCKGKVGTLGASAMGITQNYIAGTPGNGVVCQQVAVAFTDPYSQGIYQGGAFRESLVESWLEAQGSDYMLPRYEKHPTYDRIWSWVSLDQRMDRVEQPALHIGGWYDIYSLGTLRNFQLRQREGGAGAAGKQKLVMGPWHHYYGTMSAGELIYPEGTFGPAWDIVGSNDEWFAYWLKDVPNGIMDLPPIAFYQMGPTDLAGDWNEWRAAESWPPDAEPYDLYLTADGALATTAPGGEPQSLTYTFDPTDPVPTLGGANLFLDMGPYDQRPVENRPDVLLFRSEPLTEAVETAGPVQAKLWISSDALDTDFTAKLVDIHPDGRAMLVCDGIFRARYRNGFEEEELLTPGEIVPVGIDLWETAITFGPGHRIGLDISSSNSPRFDVNPNTGEAVHFHTELRVAQNAVHMGGALPSHLRLRRTNP